MDKRVKKLWVKALKSGKYKQGQGYLATDDGHCCLGVLCDLAVKEGVLKPPRLSKDHDCRVFGKASIYLLPPKVAHWAKLKHQDPPIDHVKYTKLTHANDGGLSFETIADIIEEQL